MCYPTACKTASASYRTQFYAKASSPANTSPATKFAPDDERRLFNFFRGDTFRQTHAVAQRLDDWARDHGRDIAQLAIAWVLANPAVSAALVGAKSPAQVQHNARAADWRLTPADLAEIETLMDGFRMPWGKDD